MKHKIRNYLVMLILIISSFGCVTTQKKPSRITNQAPPLPENLLYSAQLHGTKQKSSFPLNPPTGSLWSSSITSLYRDIKAHKIGDIVTITISEEADASEEAKTETKRTHGWNGQLSASTFTLAGKNLVGGDTSFKYGSEFGRTLKGSGKTTRTNSVTAYMTATVIDVLPNGNLVIRGSRWVKVNDELHQIVLEGVIRPVDITRNNTILSQKIADAKIFVVGKGPISRHQKPGWLGQIIDLLFPL